MEKLIFAAIFLFPSLLSAAIKLEQLSIPDGFHISFYATDVRNARQMAVADSGMVFVGSMRAGKVYALFDSNNDGKADKRWTIAEKLTRPSGIAWKDGDLYVAAVNQIIRFPNIEQHLDAPESDIFFSGLPDDIHHGWKYIRFDQKGNLIIPVGAPCNICEVNTNLHARILSLDMQTKKLIEVAKGVRNSVGFDFHPESGELWFSENGRDLMGDDIPADEINRVTEYGMHYGYPYIHAGDIKDPEYGAGKKPEDYVAPVLNLGAHVAALGIHFYQGKMLPEQYHKQLLVAEHGSWNRSNKSGYKIGLATLEGSKVTQYESFISGFMQNEKTYGRPVAIIELKDGSLLISDDYAHVIYRVSYK